MRNNEFCKATKCEKSTKSICNIVVKPSYYLRQHNRIISGTFLKTITIFFHINSECTFNAHFFFKGNICRYKQYVDNVDTPIPLVPMNSLFSCIASFSILSYFIFISCGCRNFFVHNLLIRAFYFLCCLTTKQLRMKNQTNYFLLFFLKSPYKLCNMFAGFLFINARPKMLSSPFYSHFNMSNNVMERSLKILLSSEYCFKK